MKYYLTFASPIALLTACSRLSRHSRDHIPRLKDFRVYLADPVHLQVGLHLQGPALDLDCPPPARLTAARPDGAVSAAVSLYGWDWSLCGSYCRASLLCQTLAERQRVCFQMLLGNQPCAARLSFVRQYIGVTQSAVAGPIQTSLTKQQRQLGRC